MTFEEDESFDGHIEECNRNEMYYCNGGDLYGPCDHELCSGGCVTPCSCACHRTTVVSVPVVVTPPIEVVVTTPPADHHGF